MCAATAQLGKCWYHEEEISLDVTFPCPYVLYFTHLKTKLFNCFPLHVFDSFMPSPDSEELTSWEIHTYIHTWSMIRVSLVSLL